MQNNCGLPSAERTVLFTRAFVEAIAYFKKNRKESVQVILMRMSPEQAKYVEWTWDQYANTLF